MEIERRRYAGIGSRETPDDILLIMQKIGQTLGRRGWILHSGGANGADLVFEHACNEVQGDKRIFLPWRKFNNSDSPHYEIPDEAFEIAKLIHPAWDNCNDGVRKFHARNVQQIMGKGLDTPVEVVICWTKGGKAVGGTATAINLAIASEIPVFNLAIPKQCIMCADWMEECVLK